jgi:iron only hydrogenase large subunit-like protein
MFAGSVMLGDLDDFINPSQSCINPLFSDDVNKAAAAATTSSSGEQLEDTRGIAKISLENDFSAPLLPPDLIKLSGNKTAKITLNDCLACSGCVTSAETVLIQQQSISEMFRALSDETYSIYAIMLSPQAISSVACHFSTTPVTAYSKLSSLFKSLGFHLVVDTILGGDIALKKSCEEFIRTFRSSKLDQTASAPAWEAPPPTIGLSSTRIQEVSSSTITGVATSVSEPMLVSQFQQSRSHVRHLPILASSCPGWVCYAEKTVPEAIPYISSVKSPQQITGALIKHLLGWRNTYVVSVMPCFDKKLEASRKDFFWEKEESKEVDCVITSIEILDLISEKGISWDSIPEDESFSLMAPSSPSLFQGIGESMEENRNRLGHIESLFRGLSSDKKSLVSPVLANYESDGYLETIARVASKEIFSHDLPVETTTLASVPGKNVDFREFTVSSPTNPDDKLVFVRAYGYRNIQTVVNRLKRGNKSKWNYVEIMACPSGCVGGGGQIRSGGDQASDKARVSLVSASLHSTVFRDPLSNPSVKFVQEHVLSSISDATLSTLLFTTFHHVPKLETSAVKW